MFINICFGANLGGAFYANIWLPVSHPQSGSYPKASCLAISEYWAQYCLIFRTGLKEDEKRWWRKKDIQMNISLTNVPQYPNYHGSLAE